MTDRELLELAAKAAGRDEWVWSDDDECMQSPPKQTPYGDAHSYWNPLTDDGDALRLAVKLKMGVAVFNQHVSVGDDFGSETHQEIGDDPYAATRRAIVRAAAEVERARG